MEAWTKIVGIACLWSLGAGLLAAGEAAPPSVPEGEAAEALPTPPPPPPLPEEPEEKPEPDVPDEPVPEPTQPDEPVVVDPEGMPGQIAGGRVNIRSGPSTRYEIIVTLDPGSPVQVYGKKDDWYEIAYPEGQHCYVHQRFIEGNIPPDIPPDGLLRAITGEESVRVRVRPWNKSTTVGTVKSKDLVTITEIRGEWAKIKPPQAVRAWVYGKYVQTEQKVVRGTDAKTEAPPKLPGTEKKTQPGESKKSTLAERAEEKKQEKLRILRQRQTARRRAHLQSVRSVVEEINAQLAAIEEEAAGQMPQPQPKSEDEPEPFRPGELEMGGFTGWVEYIGRVGRRPAAFRLVKGGEVLFLLRSSAYDLADYVHKRVAVDGNVAEAPGFQANVLIVNYLRVLGQPPAPVQKQKPLIRRPYVRPGQEPLEPPPSYEDEAPAVSEVEETTAPLDLPRVVGEDEAGPGDDSLPPPPVVREADPSEDDQLFTPDE